MDYAEAIRAWRKHAKLSQAELGEALGYGQSRIGNYEARTREPSWHDLGRIAEHFGVDVPGFLRGPAPPQYAGAVLSPEGGPSSEEYLFVNKVDGVILSAGPGYLSFEHEEVDKSHAFTRSWMNSKGIDPRRARILPVTGDSMAPYVLDGDVVLVNLADTKIRSGEVFAINVDGECRIKRLIRTSAGVLEIKSDNPSPQYPTEELRGDEVDRLHIIGRVVWRGGGLGEPARSAAGSAATPSEPQKANWLKEAAYLASQCIYDLGDFPKRRQVLDQLTDWAYDELHQGKTSAAVEKALPKMLQRFRGEAAPRGRAAGRGRQGRE